MVRSQLATSGRSRSGSNIYPVAATVNAKPETMRYLAFLRSATAKAFFEDYVIGSCELSGKTPTTFTRDSILASVA
jgi:hypothetical protein